MFGKKDDAGVFSVGQTSPRLTVPPLLTVPIPPEQLLYADKWKEFDKLQKAVKSHGAPQLARTFFDLMIFGSGLFGVHHYAKKYTLLLFVIWGAIRRRASSLAEREEPIPALAVPTLSRQMARNEDREGSGLQSLRAVSSSDVAVIRAGIRATRAPR